MKKERGKIILFKSLAILASSAFLAAISIICGKYLAIPGGDILRFSFENMPIMMASMAFGPFVGMAVGIVADLIGCVLVGYTINPVVTLGAALIGLVSGFVYFLMNKLTKSRHSIKVAVSVASAHIVGSVIVKTIGLAVFYAMPIWMLMLWRLLNYAIVGTVEGVLLWYLFKNRLIRSQINSILRK